MFSSQLDGYGDGRERVRDSLNLNCSVFSVHDLPDLINKCCNDYITLDGAGDVGEENINFADIGIVTPIIPLFFAIFGSLCKHAICNCFPHRHAINRDTHSVGMWHSFQDSFCGRGK